MNSDVRMGSSPILGTNINNTKVYKIMDKDKIYNMLEKIKDISNGINSTNCHKKRVEIRDIVNDIQILLLE